MLHEQSQGASGGRGSVLPYRDTGQEQFLCPGHTALLLSKDQRTSLQDPFPAHDTATLEFLSPGDFSSRSWGPTRTLTK